MVYLANDTLELLIIILSIAFGFLVINFVIGLTSSIGIWIAMAVTRKTARKLFFSQWARNDRQRFERGCSNPNVDYHLDMYNQGLAWREKYKDTIKKLHIVNDNLNLYGEFYDFGFERTAIVIPGRSETCYYGAYYGEVFRKNGYNLFTFDQRSHGISDGKFNTLGILECKDVIKWANLLHDEYHSNHILLYGICGGATCSLFTLTDESCPSYIDLFISDGMYYSFFETYRQHIKEKKKPVYPVIWHFFAYFKKYAKVDPYSAAPYKMIKKIDVPLMIISGEKDIFALPKYAIKLYNLAGSKDKKLSIIKNGRHSHVRYDNKTDFDYEVSSFLNAHNN